MYHKYSARKMTGEISLWVVGVVSTTLLLFVNTLLIKGVLKYMAKALICRRGGQEERNIGSWKYVTNTIAQNGYFVRGGTGDYDQSLSRGSGGASYGRGGNAGESGQFCGGGGGSSVDFNTISSDGDGICIIQYYA